MEIHGLVDDVEVTLTSADDGSIIISSPNGERTIAGDALERARAKWLNKTTISLRIFGDEPFEMLCDGQSPAFTWASEFNAHDTRGKQIEVATQLRRGGFATLPLWTIEHAPGEVIRRGFGLVTANIVTGKGAFSDVGAGVRNLSGGEFKKFTAATDEAIESALQRLRERAGALGANAVVGLRITSADVFDGAIEIIAYGSAVETGPAVNTGV